MESYCSKQFGWTHRGRRSKVIQVYERVRVQRVHIAPLHTASVRVGVRGEDVKQRNKNIENLKWTFFLSKNLSHHRKLK